MTFFVKMSIFDVDFLPKYPLFFKSIYAVLKTALLSIIHYKNKLGTHMSRGVIDRSFSEKWIFWVSLFTLHICWISHEWFPQRSSNFER